MGASAFEVFSRIRVGIWIDTWNIDLSYFLISQGGTFKDICDPPVRRFDNKLNERFSDKKMIKIMFLVKYEKKNHLVIGARIM